MADICKHIITKYKVPLLYLFIIAVQVIRYTPFKFGGWNHIQMSFSYSYGFIQRGFLGTVIELISTICKISSSTTRVIFCCFGELLFLTSIIFFFLKTIKLASNTTLSRGNLLLGLSILFLIGPGWSTYYYNFGHSDIYLISLTLFACYLLITDFMSFLIIPITALCVLIHQGYIFMFLNIILVLLIYKVLYLSNIAQHKKYYLILFVISLLLCSILFVYLQYYSHARDGITVKYVQERAANFVHTSVRKIGYDDEIKVCLFRGNYHDSLRGLRAYWLHAIVAILLYSPFLLSVVTYWKDVTKKSLSGIDEQIKPMKVQNIFYFIIPWGFVTTLPLYVMQYDYGRWTYAAFLYEFMVIYIFNFLGDSNFISATERLIVRIKKYPFYFVVYIAYISALGAFEQNWINNYCQTIIEYLNRMSDYIRTHA